jgi:hypothetical protein
MASQARNVVNLDYGRDCRDLAAANSSSIPSAADQIFKKEG